MRVLIDGVGCGYLRSPIAERLAAAGIRTERFMHYWQPWRMPFVNMRNHKKLLIVDGAVGFTGGLNISAQCLLADHPRNPVNDLHFRFEGPIVTQLMVTFAEDWNFMTGEVLDGDRLVAGDRALPASFPRAASVRAPMRISACCPRSWRPRSARPSGACASSLPISCPTRR